MKSSPQDEPSVPDSGRTTPEHGTLGSSCGDDFIVPRGVQGANCTDAQIHGGFTPTYQVDPNGQVSRELTNRPLYGIVPRRQCAAHSSSGLGHRPLKAETTGSNPVCATDDEGR